jgi:hypothetical protein
VRLKSVDVTELEAAAVDACDRCASLCENAVQTHTSFAAATVQFSTDQIAILACREVCRLAASAVRDGDPSARHVCEWCAAVCVECASRQRLNCDRWSELRGACNDAARRCFDVAHGEGGSS